MTTEEKMWNMCETRETLEESVNGGAVILACWWSTHYFEITEEGGGVFQLPLNVEGDHARTSGALPLHQLVLGMGGEAYVHTHTQCAQSDGGDKIFSTWLKNFTAKFMIFKITAEETWGVATDANPDARSHDKPETLITTAWVNLSCGSYPSVELNAQWPSLRKLKKKKSVQEEGLGWQRRKSSGGIWW